MISTLEAPSISDRPLAPLCQHLLAIFQTAGVIPGASKPRGFDGHLPFEIIMVTFGSADSGNGIFPVVSWE